MTVLMHSLDLKFPKSFRQEKIIPQVDPHKYLIFLYYCRCRVVPLPLLRQHGTGFVPLLCRLGVEEARADAVK